jgi:hypothetical protein
MSTPRMRTAEGVLTEIKAQDPATEVTLHYIRYLIHTNQVPVVPVGRKKLVDVDAVIAHLAAGCPTQNTDSVIGQIRRVPI